MCFTKQTLKKLKLSFYPHFALSYTDVNLKKIHQYLHRQSIYNGFTLKTKGPTIIPEHFGGADLTEYRSL